MLDKKYKFPIMSKFWGSNVEYSNYSQQHFIMYLKVAKKVDIKCSQHEVEMVIMLCDASVN